MGLSDLAQRVYLEARREDLLTLQVLAYHQAVTARNQAADLVHGRAHPAEIERLRQVASTPRPAATSSPGRLG
jgi:hypothetical protein